MTLIIKQARIRLWSSLLPAALILSACGGGSPVVMDPDIESDVVSLVAGGGCADGTNSSGVASAITLDGSGVYSENFDGLGSSGLPIGWSVCEGVNLSQANQGILGNNITFDATQRNWAFAGGAATNRASIQGLVEGSIAGQQNASTNRALANRAAGNPQEFFGQSFIFKLENTTGFQDFRLSLEAQTNFVRRQIITWAVEYRVGPFGGFTRLGTYRTLDFGSTTLNLCNLDEIGPEINNQSDPVFFRIRPINIDATTRPTSQAGRSGFAIDNFQLTYRSIPSGRPLRPLRPVNCFVRPTRG